MEGNKAWKTRGNGGNKWHITWVRQTFVGPIKRSRTVRNEQTANKILRRMKGRGYTII